MFFKKNKSEKKLDVASINELVSISKRVVNILFILGIGCLIYLISRLLVDWGVIRGIKTLIKIMAPLFIGFIIAWLLDPIVDFFQNKGWKRSIATFFVFFLFLVLLLLFFWLIIPTLGRQIQDAIGMLPGVVDSITSWVNNFFDRLTKLYDYDFTGIKDNIFTAINAYTSSISEGIPNMVFKLLSAFISGSITFVVSLFIAFYLLFDFDNFRKNLLNFLPKKIHADAVILIDRLDDSLKNYVQGTLVVTLILFTFQSLGFVIAGLKAPLVFGLICAITNIIPYVGPYIGGIPAVIVGFSISPVVGTLTLIAVVIAQFLESYILTPIVLSKTMKLHPVTIIIGLLVFEHFFGIIGMLISTPVISCLKIIFTFFDERFKIFEKLKG